MNFLLSIIALVFPPMMAFATGNDVTWGAWIFIAIVSIGVNIYLKLYDIEKSINNNKVNNR